jgi:chemotaxis protein methyltransferase CheR
LQKILRKESFKNFKDYYDALVNDSSGVALSELANNISTNYTYFYRENEHFDFFVDTALKEILKKKVAQKSNDIRLWSAGCSSGEEPYTLMMMMMQKMGDMYSKFDAGILATDISLKALTLAKEGVYEKDKLKRLPEGYSSKYFEKLDEGTFKIKNIVKKEVTFRRFNLMNDIFPFKKQFDAIFCRNVMIYFDNDTRATLVRKFYDFLEDGGYLFIGHSETIRRGIVNLKPIAPAIYKKEG